ncbi:MAG: class I mannose-6-phosphate isomerase [Oscillospiraceae bacterium]|jgi:mannose-6-phosphate isomerase|nr:class I mannose-6-phosphate isomerase [Oscillospiraceae bacterium]
MIPFIMKPAYRFGAQTPWGGRALKDMFGKDAPDDRTGESLEVSALPGLESRDPSGRTLSELAARYGQSLTGTRAAGAFPLLLKLLDARERLSVQVHPDNAYASRREGKLGKTEAWLILNAEPDAELIYGLASGVDAERLRGELARMGEPGAAGRIEACFNSVPVKPGDVFYIPAGTVHAIGAGIALYEIQQSSDVTYRLWDGMRRDSDGRLRELHIDRALDVIQPPPACSALSGVSVPDGVNVRTVYIANEYFALERLSVRGAMRQTGDRGSFAMLTALGGGALAGGGFELSVRPGDTALVPADAPQFDIIGELDVIKSYVPDRRALCAELGGRACGVAGLLSD